MDGFFVEIAKIIIAIVLVFIAIHLICVNSVICVVFGLVLDLIALLVLGYDPYSKTIWNIRIKK